MLPDCTILTILFSDIPVTNLGSKVAPGQFRGDNFDIFLQVSVEDVLFDLAGTMSAAEEESEYEYSDSEEDSEDDLLKISSSPYSSLPLPEFNEDEVKAAEELCAWLILVGDDKNNFIKDHPHENKCDIDNSDEDIDIDGDPIEEYSEDCHSICEFYGETDEFGRFHGEAEICFKNGDKIFGHFHHGFKHGVIKEMFKF